MRYEKYKKGDYCILSGFGSGMCNIFLDDSDYARFIFLILFLQSPIRHNNVFWYTNRFLKKGSFGINEHMTSSILRGRHIELAVFSILPNQFHLIIKNLEEGLVSVYMQRVLTAYGKYYNSKYTKSGHVFNGPYLSKKLKNIDHAVEVSALLHKLPNKFDKNFDSYYWTSFSDYVGTNRWPDLLKFEPLMSKFKTQSDYKSFVNRQKELDYNDFSNNSFSI
jgi:hypothetical protein